jgi:hypothetical protein
MYKRANNVKPKHMQKLHESKFLTIELHEQPFKHLVTRWDGFTKNEDFLNSIDLILKCIATNNAKLVLNDIRTHQGVGPDAQAEAAKKVKEFVEKKGPFKQAMLVSDEIFLQFSSKNFDKKLKAQVKDEINKFFSNEKDALAWLSEPAS